MNPKFILVSRAQETLKGIFVYGRVFQHKELLAQFVREQGYAKVHGGGWYEKDDERKVMALYGRSGDYGDPDFRFLDCIPKELEGYAFTYSRDGWEAGEPLDVSGVEWM